MQATAGRLQGCCACLGHSKVQHFLKTLAMRSMISAIGSQRSIARCTHTKCVSIARNTPNVYSSFVNCTASQRSVQELRRRQQRQQLRRRGEQRIARLDRLPLRPPHRQHDIYKGSRTHTCSALRHRRHACHPAIGRPFNSHAIAHEHDTFFFRLSAHAIECVHGHAIFYNRRLAGASSQPP